tara:strand:+ start:35 stop:145 length:111 start_codon:yes stop_codon:yes gene_type:complete
MQKELKATTINDLVHEGDEHEPESIMSSGIDNFNTE